MSRVNQMPPTAPTGDAMRTEPASRSTALRVGAVCAAVAAISLLALPATAAAPAPTTAPTTHAKKAAKGPAQPAAPFVSPYARAAAQHSRAPQTASSQGPTAMQAAGKSRVAHSPRTVTKRH